MREVPVYGKSLLLNERCLITKKTEEQFSSVSFYLYDAQLFMKRMLSLPSSPSRHKAML